MSDKAIQTPDPSDLRQRALSRWENEGGAEHGRRQEPVDLTERSEPVPDLRNAELVQLRVRVIALENLMIAVLATASDGQLDLVREMAAYISPRPGSTQHPLTLEAANQMLNLVERAARFSASSET